jgi:TonB family protein
MKYLKALIFFIIGFVLMKITNSTIHDLLLVNKPPGISLWRAYLPSVISLIPLIYFSYKALLCIGYKKIDFKLRKKITSYGVTRRRIIGRRMEVILFRFVILFGIIFFIYTNYVSNEVAKITEQPPTYKPYDGEVIPLDETKRFDPDKPYTVLESKKGQYDVEGALNEGYSISQIEEHMKANNLNPINPDKKYNLDTFGFLIKEDIPIDETKQFQTPPSPKVVNNYGNLLKAHLAKYIEYPRSAQLKEIEGLVIIEIQIRGDGSLISKYIKKSSGHEILDKAAMNGIERSKPFPLPPQASKDSVITVDMPFNFNLL